MLSCFICFWVWVTVHLRKHNPCQQSAKGNGVQMSQKQKEKSLRSESLFYFLVDATRAEMARPSRDYLGLTAD